MSTKSRTLTRVAGHKKATSCREEDLVQPYDFRLVRLRLSNSRSMRRAGVTILSVVLTVALGTGVLTCSNNITNKYETETHFIQHLSQCDFRLIYYLVFVFHLLFSFSSVLV